MCPWPVEGFAEWDRLGDPSAPPEPGRGDSCCCEETPSAEGTSPPRAAWDVEGLDWAMASAALIARSLLSRGFFCIGVVSDSLSFWMVSDTREHLSKFLSD